MQSFSSKICPKKPRPSSPLDAPFSTKIPSHISKTANGFQGNMGLFGRSRQFYQPLSGRYRPLFVVGRPILCPSGARLYIHIFFCVRCQFLHLKLSLNNPSSNPQSSFGHRLTVCRRSTNCRLKKCRYLGIRNFNS